MEKMEKMVVDGVEYTVECVDVQSRWTGTGYRDVIYRIVGTDDAIIEVQNPGFGGPAPSIFDIRKGYFAARREYARRAGKIAKQFSIPFCVALAIADRPKWAIEKLAAAYPPEEALWELNCGINRRKMGIAMSIDAATYEALRIEGMGQKHSMAVAGFLLEKYDELMKKYIVKA